MGCTNVTELMDMVSMKKASFIFIAIAIFICSTSYFIYDNHIRTYDIELGIFTESNWDVSNGYTYDVIDKAIEKFEAKNKGVRVHYYSGIRKRDYNEWLSEKILMGETPDVFMIYEEQFADLVSKNILLSLDTLIDNNQNIKSWEYFPAAWNGGLYKGNLYALPYETNFMLMAVNKTLLENHGYSLPSYDWTWDDFYSLCSNLTVDEDGDSIIDTAGVCNYTWKEAVYSNGAKLFDDSFTESYFSDQKVINSIRFMQKLNALTNDKIFTNSDFDNGKVAFMPVSFAKYKTYISYPYKITKDINYEWQCTTMPAGLSGNNISEVNTLFMGVSRTTKKKKLAFELLEILTHDYEIQMAVAESLQGTSALRLVASSSFMKNLLTSDTNEVNSSYIGLPAEIMDKGLLTYKTSDYSKYMILAGDSIASIISDKKDAENALKILQRTMQEQLER